MQRKNKAMLINVAAILLTAAVVTGCGSSSAGSAGYYADESAPAAAEPYYDEYPVYSASYKSADSAMPEEAPAEEAVEYEEEMAEYDESYDDVEAAGSGETTSESGSESSQSKPDQSSSRKLIRTANYSVETEDLDRLDSALAARVNELGGYIESSSIDGSGYTRNVYDKYGNVTGKRTSSRYGNYTIRIPAENLDRFVQTIEDSTNVLSHSSNVEDITLRYVDVDSRRAALETEVETLNNMMSKAETVEEMIQIENALTDVRYELQNIKSQLKVFDNQVMYSTVYLNVTEVEKYTDVTVEEKSALQRMTEGFTEDLDYLTYELKEAGIWFVSNLPHIILWVVIIVLGIKIIQALYRRKNQIGPDGLTRAQRRAKIKEEKRAARRAGKMAGKTKQAPETLLQNPDSSQERKES